MIAFFKILLGWIDPISKITGQIADAIKSKHDAKTEQERIASDERIKTLSQRRDVLVAQSQHPLVAFAHAVIRTVLVIPAAAFLWKVIIWDKLLGWGATDDLSENLWYYVFMVLGFYFLDSITYRLKRK